MSRAKQLITVAGTFAIAMGAGYFVQNGNANASLSQQQTIPVSESNPDLAAQAEGAIQDPVQNALPLEPDTVDIATASALPAISIKTDQGPVENGIEFAAVEIEPMTLETQTDVVPSAEVAELSCSAELTATPNDKALVTLDLNAPCQKNVRATVHHQGMHFTQLTDEKGQFSVEIPALAEAAIFIVAFPNGEGAVANTTVSTMNLYDRVVLQWKGHQTFEIHARENGADYGDLGHIWNGAAQADELGNGGFLNLLGSNDTTEPLMAEIYSFPAGASASDGIVDFTIEAEITADNCGIDVSAETMQIIGGTDATVRDIAMEMPDCDALGDYLVLNNLYENLTLAQN